jgi:O-acetylhomoserine/O-acetylserine sulfhydrylase-like pyridoxal-dependent enzyme
MSESRFLGKKVLQLKDQLHVLETSESEEAYFKRRSNATLKMRQDYGKDDMLRYKSLTLPLFMTTAGGPYDSLIDGALLLSYQTTNDPNKIYSRIDNINPDHLAWKFAALEGFGVQKLTQGLCTASGMSAIHMTTMAFLNAGDNFVCSNRVYGGVEQLFNVTYQKANWTPKWVARPWNIKDWEEKIDAKTRFLYVESPSNPVLFVADIPALAKLAHAHGQPCADETSGTRGRYRSPLSIKNCQWQLPGDRRSDRGQRHDCDYES